MQLNRHSDLDDWMAVGLALHRAARVLEPRRRVSIASLMQPSQVSKCSRDSKGDLLAEFRQTCHRSPPIGSALAANAIGGCGVPACSSSAVNAVRVPRRRWPRIARVPAMMKEPSELGILMAGKGVG